ncbi:hypothetical protein O3Q51_10280 [Cryomorphaceae bacterium 1068]|nr:hypothetical protein [Cryomorphaceae bacterium 1068]
MIKRSSDLFLLFSAVTIIFLSSCETDVELLAPYDETPVIYGILDYTADTQFVRINKTFLGTGDPNQYAAIKDSVEYDPADVIAKIIKYDDDGDFLSEITLEPIDIPSRDPGVFYSEDVRFYYTTQQLLTEEQQANQEEYIFELNVTIKDEEYKAETRFPGLSTSTIELPFLTSGDPQRLFFVLPSGTMNFVSETFRFTTDRFTASYSASFRMNFDYEQNDGTVVEDAFIDYDMGDFGNEELVSQRDITISLFGENLYTFWGNQLDLIPDLNEVRIQDFEFRVTGATPELNTYIEVSQPVSQFTPVLNSFTNISNGAIGLFSSVATRSRRAYISEPSLLKLNESPLTGSYSYCVQGWSGSEYLCTE